VQVAETLDKRSVLATEIVKGVMLPQFVILPLAVLLVWLALVQAIKPLNRLEERIRARNPDDLSPLDVEAVPLEVAPLVASVNDLLMRLKDSIATQKRFLADAAHQLKTPLAGLRMQADLAQREGAQRRRPEAVTAPDRPLQHPRHPHRSTSCWRWPGPRAAAPAMARQPCDLARLTMDGGARLRAARHGQAHRPRLRGRRARCAGGHADGQRHPAQGDGAQPGGQRHQLHALQRRAAGRDHGRAC